MMQTFDKKYGYSKLMFPPKITLVQPAENNEPFIEAIKMYEDD